MQMPYERFGLHLVGKVIDDGKLPIVMCMGILIDSRKWIFKF